MSPLWTKGLNVVSQPERVPINQYKNTMKTEEKKLTDYLTSRIAHKLGELRSDRKMLSIDLEIDYQGSVVNVEGYADFFVKDDEEMYDFTCTRFTITSFGGEEFIDEYMDESVTEMPTKLLTQII